MPVEETDKYIRIRIKDPDLFVDISFRTKIISAKEGIHAIIGKLKSDPDGSTIVQAYLFEKDKWTVDEAKNWVKEHKEKDSLEMNIANRGRGVALNEKGRAHANSLINAGKVDESSDWSFSADDGNKLLDDDNWSEYAKWFLGIDSNYDNETKEHYKYPFGKNGKLYRSALIAIRQRAGQQDEEDIFDAAGSLIEKIDGKEKVNKSITERRTFVIDELRIDKTEERKIMGHAAVFDTLSNEIFGFREKISPGAFKSSIKKDDIRALFNHDPNYILGRNKTGTLKLKEDDRGLAIEIVPPDTQFAKDLMTLMERGDISQMSFAFRTIEDSWDNNEKELPVRTLRKVKLFDVSPVTFPAYENTDVAVRSYETWKQQQIPERPWRLNLLRRRLKLTIGGK